MRYLKYFDNKYDTIDIETITKGLTNKERTHTLRKLVLNKIVTLQVSGNEISGLVIKITNGFKDSYFKIENADGADFYPVSGKIKVWKEESNIYDEFKKIRTQKRFDL